MKTVVMILGVCGLLAAQTQAPPVKPSLMDPSSLKARAPETYKVKFVTTKGDVVIEVTRAWAPLGADRFYNLVRNGFYDGAHFFRVLPGFVVQFGIPADPKVGRAWVNANIRDEPVKESNKKGSLTFAKSSLPNSRTTQIFINLGDNSRLDPDGFAPFGKVIEGMNVVEQFYTGYGESPNQGRIQEEGKVYLDRSFPKLDSIKTARILPATGETKTTPVAKPASK